MLRRCATDLLSFDCQPLAELALHHLRDSVRIGNVALEVRQRHLCGPDLGSSSRPTSPGSTRSARPCCPSLPPTSRRSERRRRGRTRSIWRRRVCCRIAPPLLPSCSSSCRFACRSFTPSVSAFALDTAQTPSVGRVLCVRAYAAFRRSVHCFSRGSTIRRQHSCLPSSLTSDVRAATRRARPTTPAAHAMATVRPPAAHLADDGAGYCSPGQTRARRGFKGSQSAHLQSRP